MLELVDEDSSDAFRKAAADSRIATEEATRALEDFDRLLFVKGDSGRTNINSARANDVAGRSIHASRGSKSTTVSPYEFAAYEPIGSNPNRPELRVASILDPFSQAAFSFEWTNIVLSPTGWRDQMENERPDLLFVESAWQGNDGSWTYMFTGPSAPRIEVIELLKWCGDESIPTVFWNKEDPPHYEDFLRTAALFDVVLTSDVTCIPKYKADLGHDRIHVLPFAAQPRLHNPARPGKVTRDREVAFGGMYFHHKYPERRAQMDYLLPAANEFSLDIYSRQLGGDPNYQFPSPFSDNVRGSLKYDEMLTAYHAYKIFLNVNSVTDSPSMCARRIFEITASGATVVTPPTPAIKEFFPDQSIPVVVDEKDTYHQIRGLLRSEDYRTRKLHIAQRHIWENHTYSQRVKEVCGYIGLTVDDASPSVSVLAPTIRPDQIDTILQNVGRQRYRDIQLVLNTHGFDIEERELRKRASEYGIENLALMSAPRERSLGSCLNQMVGMAEGDVLSKMDDDDFYAENYIPDLVHALHYSSADVVGKAATYIYFESKDATVLTYESHEHRYSDFVRGATLTARRETFVENPFRDLSVSEDSTFLREIASSGGLIYSADRFNYVINRKANTSEHTWQVGDHELFASGPVCVYGSPLRHVSV
ncbi:glycosyltransferase family protein [Arthrobacter dokdonensis]|uniref:glycosyltransferase family protein n=1 Tax=Arthrobacter dokdonellae TaxID=2211210 RepID=UPI0014949B53|nr:glycosyltransferase [Arthrobacter dokdonellae]